ncbi:MAG: hypothetical protein ACTSUK_00285 [Promethearchaeota archaeon]
MGRDNLKKKVKKGISLQDYRSNLQKIKKLIDSAQNLEELEVLKLSLIKLYEKGKSYPKIQELEPFRITLFKTCNLNIQFLNLENDVWYMFSQGKISEAYELILKGVGTMNTHPDREYIHDWVKNKIIKTLEKIAEIATEQKKTPSIPPSSQPLEENPTILNPLARQGEKGMIKEETDFNTSVNKDVFAPTSFSPSTTNSPTILPKSRSANATILPHNDTSSERTRRLRPDDDFETLFKPKDFTDDKIEQINRNSFPINEDGSEDNPIQTYWVRNQNIKKNLKKKTELPKRDNQDA